MCGRYFLDPAPDDEALASLLGALNRRAPGAPVKTGGEVFPTDLAPVVARSRAGTPRAFAMRWGYTLGSGRRVINARSETAAASPLFANGMAERRLLVPASGYYEWLRDGKNRARYAVRQDGRPTIFMAGIYRYEQDGPVFAILTRAPSQSVAFLHDRMPVILPPDAARDWLDPQIDAAAVLQKAALAVDAKPAP